MTPKNASQLFQPLELPCGAVLKSRIIKSAMSDSLGDGRGNPTRAQTRLYERWAHGGVAASIVGEVQSAPINAELPGNLVLRAESALDPVLADKWLSGLSRDPVFPQFSQPPEGAITAWYTMRLTQLGEDRDAEPELDILAASSAYEQRDQERAAIWNQHFYG